MHQFKVSGLNTVHLICDSYFNFQEVIGLRMHQFKISGLNTVRLICDSYFNLKAYGIQTTYLELMHSYPYYFLFTQCFHDYNFEAYSSS